MYNRFSFWLFERRIAILAVIVLVALLCSPMAALASNNDLPWNTALWNVSLMPSPAEQLSSSP